jgi:DNA repair photolyase
VPTLEERAWRSTEPRTPHPRARLEAVAELTRAGIRTGVLVAPLMPGINDAPAQVRAILDAATEAGASYVTGIGLHLRRGVREVFMEWLAGNRPELVPRYRELYERGAYLPVAERRRRAALLHGPDLTPGQRWGGRLEPRRAPAARGAVADRAGWRRGRPAAGSPPAAGSSQEAQTRLF